MFFLVFLRTLTTIKNNQKTNTFTYTKQTMIEYIVQSTKEVFLVRHSKNRITELDFFRGIALLLMVYFHLIWSMNQLYGYHVFFSSWINFYIGKISAILFILISGIVFSFGKFSWKRFLLLTAIALSISGVTYFYNKEYFIVFGIIHFFALSSLLAPVFKNNNKYFLILLWIWVIIAWSWIGNIQVQSVYLFFLWAVSKWFQSVDFYPLIPRFGVYLLWIGISKIFYAKKKNLFWNIFNIRSINFVGRNTLLIYLIHQPIIILVLYIINGLR